MATVSADLNYPSLYDQVKRMDPDGAIAPIVEQLTLFNPILQDAPFIEGNLPTGHRFTTRTGLPSIGWRYFNQGVTPGKSKTDQVDETCGMLEGWSYVDCALAKLNGNEAAFRASEDMAFVQAFNNEVENKMFYGSTLTNPEKFMGLTPRLNSTTGPMGKQIVKNDTYNNANAQSSIWLVGWGPDTVFGIYPKGMVGGFEMHDMGEQQVDPAGDGKKLRMYVTNFVWRVGLCVKDARYLVRICNIDNTSFSATDDNILPAMIKAYHQVFNVNGARFVWYVNRKVSSYIHLQERNFAKYQITFEEPGGKPPYPGAPGGPVMHMMGWPIRVADQLTLTEAVVS